MPKGRPKGRPNTRTLLHRVGISAILTDELEGKLWDGFLSSKVLAIRYKAFELAIKYKHGCPTQTHEIKGEIVHSLSDIERAAAQNIIAKLRSE